MAEMAGHMANSSSSKKRNLFRFILLAATVVSLMYVPWNLLWAWLAPLPETIQEQIDDAVDHGLDGIIVYVDRSGEEATHFAAGWKDRDTRVPADPQALFKIGSISKLYIAAAVARLVSAEVLSLDDTLASLMPEYATRIENTDRITLRQMVQHRSGIPNFSEHPDYPWPNPPKQEKENIEYALDQPADFQPGQDYGYSNTNYALIGEVLDKTLGYSHHRYIKREILAPLGLNNTYSLLSEVDQDDVMSGYFVGYEQDIKLNDFVGASGSMIATAQDVGMFLRALNEGTLFTDDEQAVYSSIYEYGHTGSLPGYSSIARYHDDIDAVVVQFVNTSGGKTWSMTEIVYDRILKILRRS